MTAEQVGRAMAAILLAFVGLILIGTVALLGWKLLAVLLHWAVAA